MILLSEWLHNRHFLVTSTHLDLVLKKLSLSRGVSVDQQLHVVPFCDAICIGSQLLSRMWISAHCSIRSEYRHRSHTPVRTPWGGDVQRVMHVMPCGVASHLI